MFSPEMEVQLSEYMTKVDSMFYELTTKKFETSPIVVRRLMDYTITLTKKNNGFVKL